jgi:hypothetical protein
MAAVSTLTLTLDRNVNGCENNAIKKKYSCRRKAMEQDLQVYLKSTFQMSGQVGIFL